MKNINHENTKGRKHEKIKKKYNFVLSNFRGFVIKKVLSYKIKRAAAKVPNGI
jgi:hypothetical protein